MAILNILRQANPDTQGVPYRCLDMSTRVFGVPNKYWDAWDAYRATKYHHSPAEPLPDVPVPMWFEWYGWVDGVYDNWGHVAVWFPGKGILSSPFSSSKKQQWFSSPQALLATLGGGVYVGWSEDINDVRVVAQKEEAVFPNPDDVRMVAARDGIILSDDEVKKWANNSAFRWPEFIKDYYRAYPTPRPTDADFVKAMFRQRLGSEPSAQEVKKWTGWDAKEFLTDLVAQYPLEKIGSDAQKKLARIKAELG